MTAYVIVDINVTDPVRHEDYKKLAARDSDLEDGRDRGRLIQLRP